MFLVLLEPLACARQRPNGIMRHVGSPRCRSGRMTRTEIPHDRLIERGTMMQLDTAVRCTEPSRTRCSEVLLSNLPIHPYKFHDVWLYESLLQCEHRAALAYTGGPRQVRMVRMKIGSGLSMCVGSPHCRFLCKDHNADTGLDQAAHPRPVGRRPVDLADHRGVHPAASEP